MSDTIDEPIEIVEPDPRWARWYIDDAAQLWNALGARLRAVEHFGSTAVPGLVAKPIIDILVAPKEWPLASVDRQALEGLGYAYLGEAGVPGREYFRRRAEHATNLAVVEWEAPLWTDNIAVRDYLRIHPQAAHAYAREKHNAWKRGKRMLLSYSDAKGDYVANLVAEARSWRSRATRSGI
jgi:GrpB-like predicted nucleotidyltransferase (UPF0157 family)